MKIVHVITRLIRAGADENTVLTCIDQANRGYDVVLIHGREFDATYYSELAPLGIRLVEVKPLIRAINPLSDLAAFIALRQLLASERPEVVHTHTSKAGILGRFAAFAARVPIVIHGVHIVPFANAPVAQRVFYLAAERMAARVTQAFINVSGGVRDLCLSARVGNADQHHVIHSGFDLARFRNANPPEDWRSVLGLDETDQRPPVVLTLGALEPRKRQRELIEHFDIVLKRVPDARLVLAGEGSQKELLKRTIADLGLERNVRLIGHRSDPERLIALADVCVLTSQHEGLPRVVMQYVAGGKTCVVSELTGIEEVITPGQNGIIVRSSDLSGAADALAELLLNPAELKRLTKNAAATDLSTWDATVMCRRIEEVYQQLARRKALSF